MTGIERLRALANGDASHEGNGWFLTSETLGSIADQIERETLPLPLFEDGEPVQFGDGFVGKDGCACIANNFLLFEMADGYRDCIVANAKGIGITVVGDERLKRPEPPDSWERLEADVAVGDACRYFGVEDVCEDECRECTGCPAHRAKVNCGEAMAADVLRRCKALAGVE